MKVTTNNHRRPIVDVHDVHTYLTPSPGLVREGLSATECGECGKEHPDASPGDLMPNEESRPAFLFRGEWQYLDEFEVLDKAFSPAADKGPLAEQGWTAARTDSAWDAVVIRLVTDDCGDPAVVVGHATW